MMYIGTTHGEAKWYLGSPNPFLQFMGSGKLPLFNVEDHVTDVQADGNELDYILRRINGLPFIEGARVLTWTGIFAKFIVRNLVMESLR